MRNFNEIGLPAPNQYDDWRSWASAFMVALDGMSGEETINFPLYVRDSSKVRDGLPVGADGDTIRVKDTDGKTRLYTFEKEDWVLANTEQEIPEVDLSGKADTSLDNLTQGAIEKILNWVTPDPTRIQAIATTFTAPTWGWVGWNNVGTGNATINGILISIGGNDAYNEGPATLFLKKGDYLTISNDAGTPWFMPCTGATLV